ncbi:unnamed protein product [Heligmosomoides polygyrus]|uniref:Rad21_Rec8_N domain-containing protein n=1 Tax=Heligmosomoides polygyrus TaxID=6339 RepID=A0A3P7Z7P7_HELPZ|nr:unnamed protein product [Heligmosomoides polygyrus]
MFFSVQLLVGRDAKFGVIWRAATSGSTRKLPRRAVVSLSIPNICHEIMKCLPSERSTEAELKSKFSLYLMGQLLYGTVLIFDRQTALFEQDARAAYEACKRITMEEFLRRDDMITGDDVRKRRRRSKLTLRELDPNIDIDEAPLPAAAPLAPEEELPPFPPPEAFLNMDRETFRAGVSVADVTAATNTVEVQHPVIEQPPIEEPATKRPRLENQRSQEVPPDPSTTERPAEPPAEQNAEAPIKPSFELSPLHEEVDRAQQLRRRKNVPLLDSDGLTISYESMKRLQLDYSSLLKTKEELHAGQSVDKYPTLHERLLPYPAYARNRFPKECIELYRSRVCDTLTYEQALIEGFFDIPDRGPASKLWHDRSRESSEESAILLPGIAFLEETPTRSYISYRQHEERPSHPVPEERPTHVSLRANDPLAADQLQLAADTLQLAADVTLPENTRYRESRSSYLEEARRLTRGTSDFDGRPSSVQLLDPLHTGDISQLSSRSAARGPVSLSPSLKARFQTEECRTLVDALANASDFVPLSSVIPARTTSKKRAAAMFASLLCLLRQTVVEVEQDEPFGEIWMKVRLMSRSSDQDTEGRSLQKSFESTA